MTDSHLAQVFPVRMNVGRQRFVARCKCGYEGPLRGTKSLAEDDCLAHDTTENPTRNGVTRKMAQGNKLTWIVSSRATKGGKTQQVTIPAAIASKLPQGVSIKWELSLVKGGLYFKYLGTNGDRPEPEPDVTLDFVPAADLAPEQEDVATDSTAEQDEDDAVVEDADEESAPF